MRDILPRFEAGAIVIAVLGGFFKCPPAPYETAFMLHDFLSRRGVRQHTTIHLVTPLPKPIPISDEVSRAIVSMLDDRAIGHSHRALVTRLDTDKHVAHLRDGGELPCDLLLGIPVHRAPAGRAGNHRETRLLRVLPGNRNTKS